MNIAGTTRTEVQNTRELIVSRVFEARCEQVWAAWTDAGIGMIAGMREGWNQSLDCLGGYLAATKGDAR